MDNENNDFRTPGQLLDHLLTEKGWSQRLFAMILDVSDTKVARLVGDKQPITAELAITLEELFGVPADRFLTLQKNLDLAQARLVAHPDPQRATRATLYGQLPVADMLKRGWINAESIKDTKTVERELMRFFAVNRLDDIPVLSHAAKKTEAHSEATPTQTAWLYRVQQIAKDMLVAPYAPGAVRGAADKMRSLTNSPESVARVPRMMTECGIRFVLVETLPSAKIDGVCFWLDDRSPVIGMSMRFNRIDNFWFVLRHEIEHVIQRHGLTTAMLDAELEGERAGTGPSVPHEERIANAAAADFCVPTAQLEAFIARKAPFFSERDVIGFARLLQRHPGIVVGQLQRKTNRYTLLRDHLVKVREIIAPNAIKDGWGDVAPVDE